MKMTTDPDNDLYVACKNGDVDIVNVSIERGVTNWDQGLRGACANGHVALANMMIARGATDWTSAYNNCRQNIKEYIKTQWKQYSAKRIQRWWHGSYPLWRELAYAPLKGCHYLRGLKRFTQALKLLKFENIENSK